MYMVTLSGPYYTHLIGATAGGFSELVMAGERVEGGIKFGNIPNPVGSSS